MNGYRFKNKDLGKYYKNVTLKKEWSQLDKDNVRFIADLETTIKAENKAAWDDVNQGMTEKCRFLKN